MELAIAITRRIHEGHPINNDLLEQQATLLYDLAACQAQEMQSSGEDGDGGKPKPSDWDVYGSLLVFKHGGDPLEQADKITSNTEPMFNALHQMGMVQAKGYLRVFLAAARFAAFATPDEHPEKQARRITLSRAEEAARKVNGDPEGLDALVDLVERNLAVADDEKDRIEWLIELVQTLHRRYKAYNRPEDLDALVDGAQRTLRKIPAGDPQRIALLKLLAPLLEIRYMKNGHLSDLRALCQILIAKVEYAYLTMDDDYQLKADWVKKLCEQLEAQFRVSHDPEDLEMWISHVTTGASSISKTMDDWLLLLQALCRAKEAKYNLSMEPTDLNSWVLTAQQAVRVAPMEYPERETLMRNLTWAVVSKYKVTGDQKDLDVFPLLAKNNQPLKSSSEAPLKELSTHQPHQDLETLKSGVLEAQDVLDSTPDDDSQRVKRFVALGTALGKLAKANNDPEVWVQCAEAFRQAIAAATFGSNERAVLMCELCGVLRTQSRLTQDSELARDAVSVAQDALTASPDRDTASTFALCELSYALELQYEHSLDLDDLEESVSAAERAVKVCEALSHDLLRPDCFSQLLSVLDTQCRLTGDWTKLEAVWAKLDAELVTGTISPTILERYCLSIYGRYLETVNPDYLEAAYLAAKQLVGTVKERDRSDVALAVLSRIYTSRYAARHDSDDLSEAVNLCKTLLDRLTDQPTKCAPHLVRMGKLLDLQYSTKRDSNDLDAAIAYLDQAFGIVDRDQDRSLCRDIMLQRSRAKRTRYYLKKNKCDIDGALADVETMLQQSDEDDDPQLIFQLTMILLDKYWSRDYNMSREDYLRKISSLQIKAIRVKADDLSTGEQITMTRATMLVLHLLDDADEASKLAQEAVQRLPMLVGRHFLQDDQQNVLRGVAGLASEACAISLKANKVHQALQQLECGRGLILRYMMDSKADLAGLLGTEHGDLVREYEALQRQAMQPIADGINPMIQQQLRRHRTDTVKKLNACVEKIRQIEGYEWFLSEPEIEEL
ncbi:uncharacterized protein GIQ15_01158 [Arthroderma uncinatum]|uniref:uncharacterized protein n=1 Tax=Arthroderma uncinatum TaxID=74035 RepID=UPI00144A6FB5|nr:uncharacterized protein GIQ15_01158 [Arthroderma uncinatum]KAF3491641.1 hypothetical protein GIQ15_01158 [Arthroderma uncinatum]